MRKIYLGLICSLFLFASNLSQVWGQCSPNCNDLNASVLTDITGTSYFSFINWTDIVSNFSCSGPVSFTLYNSSGSLIASGSSSDPGNFTGFQINDVCRYLQNGIKVLITNNLGNCWSQITFKKNIPTIIGRRAAVYCDHPMVSDYKIYIDGVPPVAFVPCQGLRTPRWVADWVTVYDCDPGVQDTVKQIRREWEFFDKDGKRAVAFDTIDVFLFPEITPDHIYCEEKDTVYCGYPRSGIGPFITFDSLNTGICDTTYLVVIRDVDKDGKLEFLPYDFESKCGLAVHVDYTLFGSHCETIYRVDVDIKQNCYGVPQSTCLVAPPAGIAPNMAQLIADGYWRCTFWVTDLDTLPPVAACKYDKIGEDQLLWPQLFDLDNGNVANTHCFDISQPVILVPTTSHDCVGHTYLPPICVYDDWSGVKQVKARIADIGSWILTPNGEKCYIYLQEDTLHGACFESHVQVQLPKSETPYQVIYEVYDYCHNVDTYYCYLFVKDRTKPVPVVDKGVTVSLGNKKVWVDAKTFDEGTWDNCGVNLFLVRRQDWYESCIDLCDSLVACCVNEHHDTLWSAVLEPDKHRDEVEAHYVKTLEWLSQDNVPCGNLIYNAWLYDLMKYATLECIDHPYQIPHNYFQDLFLECYEDYLYNDDSGIKQLDIDKGPPVEFCFDRWRYIDPFSNPGCDPHPQHNNSGLIGLNPYNYLYEEEKALIQTYEAIGGGWSDAVVFSCEDACGPVIVEILVMDYWCNWAKAWVNVWVEDQVPAQVVKDVVDNETITCKVYKDKKYNYPGETHPVSIEYIVDRAKYGSEEAYEALDAIFGGYEKAWVDPYGNYVDAEGDVLDCDIEFYDSICRCTSKTVKYRVYDEHLGYIWKDSLISDCYYEPDTTLFQKGVVAVNCSQNVFCEQTVWCDIDHCGEGYIYRKFKIWQACVDTFYSSYHVPDSLKHPVDTIYRHQRIYVGNECELNKYMFDVPGDLTIYTCGIEYDPEGSGNVVGDAGPENTGYATYKFDDDCRLIGIAHEDQVFKITGGDQACYKIIRTWYFADWCGSGGEPLNNKWYHDNSLVLDYCIQKILVYDTIAPVCQITGPVEDGGILEVSACYFDLRTEVTSSDDCGLATCYWELKRHSADGYHTVDSGEGELKGLDSAGFEVISEELEPGEYLLKVQITDECNNENYCEYAFTLVSVKKPTPVCISSLTADIIPWDTDQDGVVDSAHAVVWAYEFDRSSTAPCGVSEDSLSFYVEFVGNESDEFDLNRVSDVLEVSCEHIGTRMVRLWVVDPSGAHDYCDVLLVVQNNAGACESVQSAEGSVQGSIVDENDKTVAQVQVLAESVDLIHSVKAGEDGTYQFDAPMGTSLTVIPSKNANPMNGITTADLIQMLGHINNSNPLPSPYRRLAADVNRDGSINTLDLLELRKLILGEIARFPNSDSWRFVSKDYEFKTDKPEAENVTERLSFNLDKPLMKGDFIGMKVGDVDMDNNPGQKAPRSADDLVFAAADRLMKKGEIIQIPISATTFQQIAGYQFTLEVDPLKVRLLDYQPGDLLYLDETNFGSLHLDEGKLTTSWNATADGISVTWGQTVFTVTVQAKEEGRLSDMIGITASVTEPQSYRKGKTGGVALKFDALNLGDEIDLYQNTPNPASETTNIQFYLPDEQHINLIITDATGKILRRISGIYGPGKHSVELLARDLPSAQVYYYSLITREKTLTKKMLLFR